MAFFAVDYDGLPPQVHCFLSEEARDEWVSWLPDKRDSLEEIDALVEAAIGEGLNPMRDRDWRSVV